MSLKRSYSQWPECIPSFIRRHEEPVEWEDIDGDATRAWRYFVRERWVSGDDTADQQKRDLIEQWATADQKFRDDESFTKSDVESFCMVYICITELNEEKQALLAKCILGLFPWEDGWEFLADEIVMFLPLEGNQGNHVLDTFKLQQSVARPDFLDMHMALDGTVIFRDCYPKLIIDDRTLETGLGLWVEFGTNGIYEKAYRAQIMMMEFADFYREIGPGNQTPIQCALMYIESRYSDLDKDRDPKIILEDEPVDMWKPLVEIYLGEVDLVDDYAPGFREAEEEGNGLAIGFDLRQILANDGRPLIITDYERF
ncbi:hypothetical protein N7466_008436 [Penicillium verhagenii]|uniref:uncharacterized protein n=1 Tax=Penicillium verhagenii TaxID=1562060 RepID=UPI0025458627|nr:uncharacterized protein N7466_008436 [Penicillium verhagenii]KAJ5924249.1 hypothetical protein N7466_008436 [Penicillium verhagenii]